MMLSTKWSEHVPKEVIEKIAYEVRSSFDDLVRMGAVCRSWRIAASKTLIRNARSQTFVPTPMLVQCPLSPYCTKFRCSIYAPNHNKTYNIPRFAPLPSIPTPLVGDEDKDRVVLELDEKVMMGRHDVHSQSIQCLGSVDDWILVVDRRWDRRSTHSSHGNIHSDAKISHYMFNPVTGEHVMLPPNSTIPFPNKRKSYLKTMVASSPPITITSRPISSLASSPNEAIHTPNPNCIVAAIAAGAPSMLICCNPTGHKWTCLHHFHYKISGLVFGDDGKLYALQKYAIRYLVVFDFLEQLQNPNHNNDDGRRKRRVRGKRLLVRFPNDINDGVLGNAVPSLVRSSRGEILLFLREEDDGVFVLLKLMNKNDDGGIEWVKVENDDVDVKDEAIFIGDRGGSTSIPMSKLNSSLNSAFLGVRSAKAPPEAQPEAGNTSITNAGSPSGKCMIFFSETDGAKISVYNTGDGSLLKYPPSKQAPKVLNRRSWKIWFTPMSIYKIQAAIKY